MVQWEQEEEHLQSSTMELCARSLASLAESGIKPGSIYVATNLAVRVAEDA